MSAYDFRPTASAGEGDAVGRGICDYAACDYLATADADGWSFCRQHIYEHRIYVASEVTYGGDRNSLVNPRLAQSA